MASVAIDLTNKYHTAAYMRNGPGAWAVDRNKVPIRQIIIHHWAGNYGAVLTPQSTRAQEEAAIEANAKDHHNRFGIGPGYNYIVCPSGRLYAVGKLGTSRRHTSNINPATGHTFNWDGVAICFTGNKTAVQPSEAAMLAVRKEIAFLRSLPFVIPNVRIMGHRDSGFATGCPGDNVYKRLAEFGIPVEPVIPPPSSEVPEVNTLEALERRIRVLENATFAHRLEVTARAGNAANLKRVLNRDIHDGEAITLTGDSAMLYVRLQGLVLNLTLDNLNAAVHRLADRVRAIEGKESPVVTDALAALGAAIDTGADGIGEGDEPFITDAIGHDDAEVSEPDIET